MAQWLQNSGSTVTGTSNQIDISTLRTDVASVIAPTQSWLTLNSGSYNGQTGKPVMQMTFNAPVGAPAANQCGRVVYNDYHVFNASTTRRQNGTMITRLTRPISKRTLRNASHSSAKPSA